MRKIALIYWKNSALRFIKVFEELNWEVLTVNSLDLPKEDFKDVSIFFFVLPGDLKQTVLDTILENKFLYRKFILVLDFNFSIARKNLLLNHGVDWYFAKPLSDLDLGKYINMFSIKYDKNDTIIIYKDIVLDLNQRSFTRKKRTVYLRNKEFELLKLLLSNPGVVLTKDRILEAVWDMNADLNTTTLETHMCLLRKKLDAKFKEKRLHTVHCVGYKLE